MTKLNSDDARQGERGKPVFNVLRVSLATAVVVIGAAAIYVAS